MALKKKVAKKKVARKKVVAKKVATKKRATTVGDKPDIVSSLREQLKALKADNRELAKKLRGSERQVAALLKLLASSQTDVNKFLTRRVKDAVAKYDIVVAPKKRRRRAKKKVVQK
ncbi:MAG: hypothetical protein JMN27_13735 [gamma proteobacterium endosymbiont of Lamellibrachia anaximandri]|nr:hypothetical protein [gamma proteobacterium endosymbiont of Lamellibrachia anaximandri]MBL3534875.1 hypothetical protein [gamma proteobacterium endosymbiont of Lamellibrachia anaximandri]